jgi:hypothetical protein
MAILSISAILLRFHNELAGAISQTLPAPAL